MRIMQTLNPDSFRYLMTRGVETNRITIRSAIALSNASKALEAAVRDWANASDIWSRGYQLCREIEHRVMKMLLPMRDWNCFGRLSKQLASAFTCYCGYMSWDVLKKHSCFSRCLACGRCVPYALLMQLRRVHLQRLRGKYVAGYYAFGGYDVIDLCRFGCGAQCAECKIFVDVITG